jgi:pimeloyl-ACP methyl ester carboxylesterase
VSRVEEGRVAANGVDFAYLACGNGPLALCLHGFPESAHSWRDLLPVLADAGFRAVAPFLRGYAPSSVPPDGRYQAGVLAQDAIALHDVLGGDGRAVIVGHDWGAAATYGAAAGAPDRWRRVIGLAVPPGGALLTAVLTDVDQLKRIWYWYMFFFQHPVRRQHRSRQ